MGVGGHGRGGGGSPTHAIRDWSYKCSWWQRQVGTHQTGVDQNVLVKHSPFSLSTLGDLGNKKCETFGDIDFNCCSKISNHMKKIDHSHIWRSLQNNLTVDSKKIFSYSRLWLLWITFNHLLLAIAKHFIPQLLVNVFSNFWTWHQVSTLAIHKTFNKHSWTFIKVGGKKRCWFSNLLTRWSNLPCRGWPEALGGTPICIWNRFCINHRRLGPGSHQCFIPSYKSGKFGNPSEEYRN